jgi:flagellar biosynthesis protein FlhG
VIASPHQADALAIPAPSTPWLCIAGAKGGVGKTMLATNLALLASRAGYRTRLVDLDPGCGNVRVHLRISCRHDVEDLVAGTCTPRDALVAGPAGLHVLLGRSGSTALIESSSQHRAAVLDAIANVAADFDLVVVDTGAGLGPTTLAVAARADLTLGVTTPDVSSVTDAYALCKVLHGRASRLPLVVVNRTQSRDEAMLTATKLASVTRKFLGAETRLIGWLRHDAGVERSLREQRPLALQGDGAGLDDLRAVFAAALAELPQLKRRQDAVRSRRVRLRPVANS